MENQLILNAIKERFGSRIDAGKLINAGKTDFDSIPESIHSSDMRLSDGTILRVRHCSPSNKGELPGIYYCLVSNSRQLYYQSVREEVLKKFINVEFVNKPFSEHLKNEVVFGDKYDYRDIKNQRFDVYIKPEK